MTPLSPVTRYSEHTNQAELNMIQEVCTKQCCHAPEELQVLHADGKKCQNHFCLDSPSLHVGPLLMQTAVLALMFYNKATIHFDYVCRERLDRRPVKTSLVKILCHEVRATTAITLTIAIVLCGFFVYILDLL